MTIGDAIRLAEEDRPPDGVTRTLVRCLIYVRISLDGKHDAHGVANQMAKLEQKANDRGWTVVYRLSDNDIGVTRKDPTKPGSTGPGTKRRCGWSTRAWSMRCCVSSGTGSSASRWTWST